MRFMLEDKSKWHGKFLWWPRVIDNQLVWMETVWRRDRPWRWDIYSGSDYQYALTIPTEKKHD